MLINIAFVILFVGLCILTLRLCRASSLQEKVMVLNLICNHFIFVIILFSYQNNLFDLIDIVLVYVLLGVLSTIAITKFVALKSNEKC